MNWREGKPGGRTLLVVAAFAVQLIIIGSVIAGPLMTSMNGQEVRLKLAPVDPRDPLRGDYLEVNYEISRLEPVGDMGDDIKLKKGQSVWLPLKPDGAAWSPVEPVLTHQPDAAELKRLGASAAIKGKVASVEERTVDYGIDRYFVAEGKGTRLPSGEAIALVSLGEDGTPVLRQLYINGRVWP